MFVHTMPTHEHLHNSHRSDMAISELAALLQSRLGDIQQRAQVDVESIEAAVKLQMGSFCSNVSADIKKMRVENVQAANTLRAVIDNYSEFVRRTMEGFSRQNNLIITGVPYSREENLVTYYYAWCRALGYSYDDHIPVAVAQRLSRRTTTVNRPSVIILQFAIRSQRDEFFSRYLRACDLSLTSIGFSSSRRIFINEDLGPEERKLRSMAVKLKKHGIFHSVFSRNGIVFVKLSSTQQPMAVTSEASLGKFLVRMKNINLPFQKCYSKSFQSSPALL